MMKHYEDNSKRIRIMLLLPEECEVILEPEYEPEEGCLDEIEEDICSYAAEAAEHLCVLLQTEFLPDEAYECLSTLTNLVINASAESPVEFIKMMFISAGDTEGRKAINRAIELCGDDDALYELFIAELLDTEVIEQFKFNMFAEMKEYDKED